ncbi:hypothetical protein RHSIM_Rhsim10G0023900 [Rhododendron simsii]|uniref:Transmembrane protein n=1 Tax=Rhododendron simsii TaxID=118357 RepID=A0A834LD57_RHOSS|nr:hypothetical protein RHSIM_Rhsim10G0023900 [Rhododendron simsii]
MENTQIPMEEKLGFLKVLNKAFKIPLKNPHFIIFAVITSTPLFCFLFTSETIFQKAFLETAKIISEVPPCFDCLDSETLGLVDKLFDRVSVTYLPVEKLFDRVSFTYLLMVLFCVGILNLLDFIAVTAIVDSSSLIYEGKNTMNLKHMLQRLTQETRFKGPLITSVTVLLLASLIVSGLFSLATYVYLVSLSGFFMALFVVLFLVLLAKFIEWSAIWNMGIVISVLEEKQGDVALLISSYLSRGNRKHGFLLVLVFFVWTVVLRLSCLYLRWLVGGSGMVVLAAYASLVCYANVMKWVVFVVYFYDCKRRGQEKKNGVAEESHAIA